MIKDMEKWKKINRVPAPVLVPGYGPLSGMRVLISGAIVAGPFVGTYLSDFGAETIMIERLKTGDPTRAQTPMAKHDGKEISAAWINDGRNRLSFTLNVNMRIPESKEIYLSLVKNVDVFVENMVWLDKFGITDEMLLEVNPKLILVHINGFGNPQFGGIQEICDKPCYDPEAQAESGYSYLNGYPEPSPPMYAQSYVGDYLTAMFAVSGILMAYHKAKETGVGEVIDVSQTESWMRVNNDVLSAWANASVQKERFGLRSTLTVPANTYKTKDGRYVIYGVFGPAPYSRAVQSIGCKSEDFPFEETNGSLDAASSPLGLKLDRRFEEWFLQHTAQEAHDHMAKFKVPCGVIRTAAEIVDDPHWQQRGSIATYVDQTLNKEVKANAPFPKLKNNPGQIWRGAPTVGQDTDMILSKLLGYSNIEIDNLKGRDIID
jgi:crotonobetainyl-CoA:carnitine CoA-transferase CaiB-like acyl-CoA transferase